MDEGNVVVTEETAVLSESAKVAKALGCSESEVEHLCEIFQKEPKALPDIFAGLNWSAEKVARIAGTLSPDFIAVKFEFHQPERDGACAIFCIIFDSKVGKITDEMYWMTFGQIPPDLSVEQNWETFRARINKIGGRFDKGQFERFRAIARSVMTKETLYNIARNDSPELRAKIASEIVAGAHNLSPQRPECSLGIEHFSAARLEIGGLKMNRDDSVGSIDTKEDEFSVVCMPVIDPVNGTPARALNDGDLIWVELMDGPGMAGVVYRLLQKVGAEPLFKVISKELQNTGMLVVRFWISEEIVGTIRVSPEIRIKTALSDVNSKSVSIFAFAKLKDKIAIIVAGLLLVSFVVFIISMIIE